MIKMNRAQMEIASVESRHAGIATTVAIDAEMDDHVQMQQQQLHLGRAQLAQRKQRLASARRLSALANRCYGRVFVDTLWITGQLNALAVCVCRMPCAFFDPGGPPQG